jgi:hypothetical protein
MGTPLAALAAVVLAGGGATVSAAPPPGDGVVDLLTAANAEIVGSGGVLRAAGGGDVNGDGRDEIVVGATGAGQNGPGSGAVWVLAGRAQPVDVDLAAPGPLELARIDGAAAADNLGASVAVVGDVNGDGAADVLAGAPGADNNGRAESGSAYVIFGGPGVAEVDVAALGASGARVDGAAPDQGVGRRAAPAGDVNGDGLADILLATGETVYVVFGAPGFGDLDLASPGDRAVRITGAAGGIAGAGDVNGDGYDDVIVGEPVPRPGRAFVVFGSAAPTDVDLPAPAGKAIRILGRGDEGTGYAVAGAGDLNGDGFDDVALGAPFASGDTGAVHVVRGGPAPTDIDLAAPGARATRFVPGGPGPFGFRVAGVGDVDGNGFDDLATAAGGADFPGRPRAGAVTVLLGGPRFFRSATRAAGPDEDGILRLVGPFERAEAGEVAHAGDTDGDGRQEIVVAGVQANLKGRARAGGAWLYGYGPMRRCAAVPRPGGRPVEQSSDPIRLTRQQLVINQRIGQAAIRRVAAVERRLDAGVEDRDVCGGTISSESLVAALTPTFGAEIVLPSAEPEPITTAPPSGDPSRVRLTSQQLLINQRVYQVALLRARALATRLRGRLTGGDLAAGGLTRGRLTPGLAVDAAGVAASLPPSRSTPRIPARDRGGRVTLSAAQLTINQRIAQAAVRTANDAVSQMERGLVNDNFADRSIGADALAPGP